MKPEIKQRIEQINNGIVPDGYKKAEFGVFPCDWVTDKKLADVGVFGKGKGLPGDKMVNDGVPCVGYGDIYMKYNHFHFEKAQNFVDEETAKESQPIEKGTLLFTGTGETAEEIGKCVCYNGNETIYAGGDILTFNTKTVNPLFLAYQQYQPYSLRKKASFGQGHSVVHIQRENLEKLPIAYPADTKEQEKIAEILMKWDEAIELQEKYIEKLEEKKKAITHNIMSPKKSWNIAKLSDIVEKKKGCMVHCDDNGEYPVIDMNYFLSGSFSCFTNDSGVMATENDILVLWDGAGAGSILTGVVGIVGSTFAKLSIKTDKIDNLFLSLWLTKENNANLAKREGSGIPHMPKDYIKYQRVCFPELSEQKRISNAINKIQEEMKLKSLLLEKLKQQRKALQQYLLNGIVRVNDER